MYSVPDPECPFGYSEQQVREILARNGKTEEEWGNFLFGQTVALCDGRTWDEESRLYHPSPCFQEPHGTVVYPWDMDRFLQGLPVID